MKVLRWQLKAAEGGNANEQGIAILKSVAGVATPELCRQPDISPQTFYCWKAKFGGLDVSESRGLKKLEEESAKLKRLVADLTLDNQALKDLAS